MPRPKSEGSALVAEIGRLWRHDGRRVRAWLLRPQVGALLGVLLPSALLVGALWAAGPRAAPDLVEPAGGAAWGFVLAAPLALLSYGILFRPRDDSFVRRLGTSAASLYAVRASRLFALGLVVVVAATIPLFGAGDPVGRPLAISLGAVLAAGSLALLATAAAARAVSHPSSGRPRWQAMGMGFDPELAAVAPLFWAPLAPLLGGIIAGGWLAAVADPISALLLLSALALGVAAVAGVPYARALPRFAPRALEMTFAPAPEAGDAGLVWNRGLARLLPRAAALARARDAAIAARRFRWATTIVWPVAIGSAIALARWGEVETVREWVGIAGALTLLTQAGAMIGLGRVERAGPRWIDRSVGVGPLARGIGRWAWGFGISLWLTIPLALAWAWWISGSFAWGWILIGLATALVGTVASLFLAGR